MKTTLAAGIALLAVPLLSQAPPASDPIVTAGKLKWFTLAESRADVRRLLGRPKDAGAFGEDFESWQYQIDGSGEDQPSHLLVFRKSRDELVSVTRNFETEREVDALFPDSETTAYIHSTTRFPLRLRRLSGGRVLMAMGVSTAGQRTGQIVLMQEAELGTFYPWVVEQLRTGSGRPSGLASDP